MKLRCPRCQNRITVPDDWAGKTIRCSACNMAFRVPAPREALAKASEEKLDLESLARLEARSGGLDAEELSEVQGEGGPSSGEAAPPGMRACPHCGKHVKDTQPYAELLCSHCWKTIPAVREAAGFETGGTLLVGARGMGRTAGVGFYDGIASAFAYPVGAIGSLLTAVCAAVGAILLPVTLAIALTRTTEQSAVGTGNLVYAELTGVELALTVLFWAEVLFFAGVGVHALIDVTRASSVGEEQPPPLVWNPTQWGETIIGYVCLVIYYAVFLAVAVSISNPEGLRFPTTREDFRLLLNPTVIGTAAMLTFFVPMNLVGLSVGKLTQALNPLRIVRSIAATHFNYVFLFLLVAVLASLFVALFASVAAWFGGEISKMRRAAAEGNVLIIAGGLLSWGLVMGVGFYCVYVLGRVQGLFARTFRAKLDYSD